MPRVQPDWRIYFGDGATFTCPDDGGLSDAPTRDVQAVVYRSPDPDHQTGRVVIHRFDYYWFEEPDWFGGDLFGLFDYLARPGLKRVLFGRTMPNDRIYQDLILRACNDPDFERRPLR